MNFTSSSNVQHPRDLDSYSGTSHAAASPHVLTDSSSHLYSSPLYTNRSIDVYQAVKDYDPVYFSRSGRQDQELVLKKGEIVIVLGNDIVS